MGSFQTKYKSNPSEKEVENLREKVRHLQGEIKEIICLKDIENEAYRDEVMAFALKEAEWKKERKKLKEEVRRLGKMLEEREERIRMMDDEIVGGNKQDDKEWKMLLGGSTFAVEQMREERARRDVAVEKWKRLYHAIKIELDDLILRTNQVESVYYRAKEEDLTDELQRELNSKQETIELLQSRLVSMEQDASKREREVDILRQSLRIMWHKKKAASIHKM